MESWGNSSKWEDSEEVCSNNDRLRARTSNPKPAAPSNTSSMSSLLTAGSICRSGGQEGIMQVGCLLYAGSWPLVTSSYVFGQPLTSLPGGQVGGRALLTCCSCC